jgi:spore coat protein CotH
VHCEEEAVQASFTLSDLPRGATFDAGSGKLHFVPDLSQAASYHLELRALPSNAIGALELHVVDRWDAPMNVPVVDKAQYTEEYGLPVIHLQTDPGLNDDTYTPATVVYRGHTYTAEAQGRGQVSAGYPKRSYTLKFSKTDKFDEPEAAGGFHKKRKIVLYASFDDNSYLRQRLGFELWNLLDPRHIQVKSYSAVLFMNGSYHGLYTVLDHVDGYLMEDFGYDQQGNLYKARTHNANFRAMADPTEPNPTKTSLHDGYTKEEGDANGYADLDALITWVESSSASDFAQQIDQVMARYEYEDWWLWVSFIDGKDTSNKNSYHYHDPLLAGSVWHMVPWDLNESFGQQWDTRRVDPRVNPPEGYYAQSNGLFERLLADPSMGPALRARYGQTLRTRYALQSMLTRLDQIAKEIEPSALRDEAKWQPVYRDFKFWKYRDDFTTWREEVAYVRKWLADRHAYISSLY